MSARDPAADPALAALLADYAPKPGVADELMGPSGGLRPVWHRFIHYLAAQDPQTIERRFARGDQYLHDAGVLFRQYTGSGSTERDWPLSHIPVLIGAEEWRALAQGLIERAEVLEQVMADLHGPARLVSERMLPAELVAHNPEWLRPLVGTMPRSGHFLHTLAFEVGRSPDGSWLILGDRTQAPSGAGFALENRVATSKVFADHYPTANVERVAGFFRRFRDAMVGPGAGHSGVLTPGAHTDTYFEHAYIARYLGLLLLEGEDLAVTPDGVMVRTVAGPQPVSTLWRRLDARFADPLELDEASAIGTPGLVSAVRDGKVELMNALGSGVLEARALLAFLPRIGEHLLGRPLSIPNIATWWCGQPAERDYVRAERAKMMLGLAQSTKLPFEPDDGATVLGEAFRDAAHGSVDALLDRDGARLVGQEAVTLSTTPAMVDGRLAARPMILRVFAARTPQGWIVMPGGYARIGRSEDPTALAMQRGGSVADVWVVGDTPVRTETLTQAETGPFLRRPQEILPTRAADNLFWLGRYVERAEGRVRMLRAFQHRQVEAGGRDLPLIDHLSAYLTGFGVDLSVPVPSDLLDLFSAARGCAGKVRDRFSTDGWRALSDLAATAQTFAPNVQLGDDAAEAMSVLLRKLAGFSGLVHENMFRDIGWRFLSIGRALERADHIASMLAAFADPQAPAGGYDLAVEIGDSQITHRRRYAVETNRDTVIDLLALDPDNPRSLVFQLERLRRHEAALPKARPDGRISVPGARILTLATDLAVAHPGDLDSARLLEVQSEILGIGEALAALHLE